MRIRSTNISNSASKNRVYFVWRHSHLSATLEILSSFSQVGMAHQVLTILDLATLLEETLRVSLLSGHNVGVSILAIEALSLWHIVPVDLELGYTRLLSKDMSVKMLDCWCGRWVLVHLWAVILNIDIVSNTEELLAILVRAG